MRLRRDMSKQLEFMADRIKVNGPRIDGSYAVTFETGEYEQDKVAKILSIPQQTVVRVIIQAEDEETKSE